MLLRHWRRKHIWVALRNHLSRGWAICSMLLLINKYLRNALRRPFNIICYLPLHWPTVLGLGDEIAYCLEWSTFKVKRIELPWAACSAELLLHPKFHASGIMHQLATVDQTSTVGHHCNSSGLVVHLWLCNCLVGWAMVSCQGGQSQVFICAKRHACFIASWP
jgi:hypothetical protein